MDVRKQALSSWLTSDAAPPPPTVVHLARMMGVSVTDLLIAAGYATPGDPLMDRDDARQWALSTVRSAFQRNAIGNVSQEGQKRASPPAEWETVERVVAWLLETFEAVEIVAAPANATDDAEMHTDGRDARTAEMA
jgi:hypothetical protein